MKRIALWAWRALGAALFCAVGSLTGLGLVIEILMFAAGGFIFWLAEHEIAWRMRIRRHRRAAQARRSINPRQGDEQ